MPTTSRSKANGRDRILRAAIERFAQNSYEQTSLRAIAADADVDVAYVHRCFGSKEKLLAEAMGEATDLMDFAAGEPEALAASLSERTFAVDNRQGQALGIFIHSIASPEAHPILRQFILEKTIAPMSTQIEDASGRRASVAMALLAGVALFRSVLRIEPLIEADRQELEALIAEVLAVIFDRGGEAAT